LADTAKVLLDIANRSREEVVTGIQTMEKATDVSTAQPAISRPRNHQHPRSPAR